MDRAPASWWTPFPLTLLLVMVFLGGALAGRQGWLDFLPGDPARPALGPEFDSVVETWHLIHEHYPDREAAEPGRLAQAAIDGMLGQLGDTGHTAFLSPGTADNLDKEIEGSLEGIGATLTNRQLQPAVASVMPGSPAQTAGLRAGDVFVEIDGKDVAGQSVDRIVSQVRGPAGTTVKLRMSRPGESKPIDFSITRARIELPRVTWNMVPGLPIAHVAIEQFSERVDQQLRAVLTAAKEQGARGVIVDLRGNPGGLRDQAVLAVSEFVKSGNVLVEMDARGRQTPVPVKPGGLAVDMPMVVLVDERTVSAGEIFAAAIQDHQRGTVVGSKTFGTGTILMTFRLQDGSAVNMAVAKWLTPNGRSLWHRGLDPDVEVSLPQGGLISRPQDLQGLDAEGLKKSRDAQLLKAIELMREKLGLT